MRFIVKVSFLLVVIVLSMILMISVPESPNKLSKAELQDVLRGDDIPTVPKGTSPTQPSTRSPVTPDPLIANYGQSDGSRAGENGRGIIFVGDEETAGKMYLSKYHVNVLASDVISLNRKVPDSRHPGCRNTTYAVSSLPNVTVIIPFYDEWLSLLLRTVYSVINRTPPTLLREIILIDDASTFENLRGPLDKYVKDHFPDDLVRIVRMPERKGLIQARLAGWRTARGEVLVFLDSHMEMNIDWLQPLLVEIQNDRKTIAMSVLDYIDAKTLQYDIHPNTFNRYGFNWKLVFFEFYFRVEQIGKQSYLPRRGVTMVGAAFAVDKQYFTEIGAYDEGMKIWGGENLELSWRVWLCGGQLLHVPCSHMGHIARFQPYTFPGGRQVIEAYNYKRAVDVWFGPLKKYVYENYPKMKTTDAGDISERLNLKKRLKCKSFDWYIQTIWPELLMYDVGVIAWGSARNQYTNTCLDNNSDFYPGSLYMIECHYGLNAQGFSLTTEGYLRTTLASVVFNARVPGISPTLQSYGVGLPSTWTHKQNAWLVHRQSNLCLDAVGGVPTMSVCSPTKLSQMWTFNHYV